MEIYTNKFHNNNIYIKITEPEKVSPGELEEILDKYQKPIQIGIYSDQNYLVGLLIQSGFMKKRSTYELEVKATDLKKPLEDHTINLEIAEIGSDFYNKSARLLYDYYKITHREVNALTVDFEEFCQVLPKKVIFYKKDSKIIFASFKEENEIAYLAGFNLTEADAFLNALLAFMFNYNEEIFFEADDTDPLATILRDKFMEKSDLSYDTYIKYK